MMDMALMSFAIEELTNKGYTPIIPPYLMKREAYEGVTSLGLTLPKCSTKSKMKTCT